MDIEDGDEGQRFEAILNRITGVGSSKSQASSTDITATSALAVTHDPRDRWASTNGLDEIESPQIQGLYCDDNKPGPYQDQELDRPPQYTADEAMQLKRDSGLLDIPPAKPRLTKDATDALLHLYVSIDSHTLIANPPYAQRKNK